MSKPTTETIIRTVLLVVAVVNQALTATGKNPLPFAEDQIYTFASTMITVGATVWAWWKNNSFTKTAQQADVYLKELKNKEK